MFLFYKANCSFLSIMSDLRCHPFNSLVKSANWVSSWQPAKLFVWFRISSNEGSGSRWHRFFNGLSSFCSCSRNLLLNHLSKNVTFRNPRSEVNFPPWQTFVWVRKFKGNWGWKERRDSRVGDIVRFLRRAVTRRPEVCYSKELFISRMPCKAKNKVIKTYNKIRYSKDFLERLEVLNQDNFSLWPWQIISIQSRLP